MVGMEQAWLLPAIPAAAFVVVALFHNYLPRKGDFIAVLAMAASFVLFLLVAGDLLGQLPAPAHELHDNTSGFDWIKVEAIQFHDNPFVLRIGFLVDQLSLVMLAVVTFVGLMIFIYSVGYMKGEVRYGWFFAVISLFAAAMLTLVLADNFLLLYIVWEGVGICSYLLIGHYWERRSAAEAAKKAFITTRFGDVFLLIGIVMLWREVGTFDMSSIFEAAEAGEIDKTYLTVATLLLFGGAAGKSAQFPFHVWLPDAMEGPTPVSALIHAATMVVAGVYLVARAMPLFEASYPIALDIVIALGLITTFMSAFMGLVMTDIKRVIAYSTLNSLGLMMVALGVGSPAAAMLYLLTHGFFKALLFLSAGSIIHATEKQDAMDLGGLWPRMPITSKVFAIGAMAMAGLVPFSGFFAKDEVLVAAGDFHWSVLVLLLISVPITAMYMLRIVMLTFFGEPRDRHAFEHAHESPPIMSLPLVVLAVFAVLAGFVIFEGVGDAVGIGTGFPHLIENVLEDQPPAFEFDWAMAVISTLLVAGGLAAAYYIWRGDALPAKVAAARFPFLYRLFRNKFYVDDFYQWVINQFVLGFAKVIAFIDRAMVNDTGVNGAAQTAGIVGWVLKFQQTGKLPNYALAMAMGVAVIAIVGFAVRG